MRLAALAIVLVTGCGTVRVSAGDTDYFADPPRLEACDDSAVSLVYTQGTWQFYFSVDQRVEDERVVFFVSGFSSSGDLSGRELRVAVEDPRARELVRDGRAFWEEPDGGLAPLELVECAVVARAKSE